MPGPLSDFKYVFNSYLQGLNVSGEAWYAHEALVRDLEDSLEVAINRHELSREPGVCCYRDAVLARHGDHGVTIVLVYSAEISSLYMIQMFFG